MDTTEYPCQVCGKRYSTRLLFDLKGNVPGGCKMTCLECCGRLEERERCAKVAEAFRGGYTASLDGDYLVPDPDGPWSLSSDIAAAIRATPGGGP